MTGRHRTDLAAESRALWQESAGNTGELAGVAARDYRRRGFPVTRVEILDGRGAEALGKPVGTYTTVDLRPYFQDRSQQFAPAAEALAEELRPLLPEEGAVFVAGLGNAAMTPDAVLTDVEGALEALAELTGRAVREDVVERIFSRFCVGK